MLRFRLINTAGTSILLVFNALIGVWPMVGMNAVLLAINPWFIAKLVRERHDSEAFEVVSVGSRRRLPAPHPHGAGLDIARFQPDATWQSAAERDHAFVVLKGTRSWVWS